MTIVYHLMRPCDMRAESLNSLTRKVIHCMVTTSKEHMTAGFQGNKHDCNNRRTVGNGVFYWVHPNSI
jgi:hypothetical protein